MMNGEPSCRRRNHAAQLSRRSEEEGHAQHIRRRATKKWRISARRSQSLNRHYDLAMRFRLLLPRLILALALLLPVLPARAVEAPYESRLVRLAEILGALHYLRNLCGEHGDRWRNEMDAILKSDNPDAATRTKLIASFNRGYRSYSDVYKTCTASATAAIERYMKEGSALSDDIVTRFGN
jgi:uncharacterized protein (TIGR02301 family)